jgi:membrane-bound lytic murein transglycosylase A
MKYLISLFVILFFFWGCSPKYEQKPSISNANLQKTPWKNLEGFNKDNLTLAFEVFQKDCKRSKKDPLLQYVCTLSTSDITPKDFFHNNFTPYQLIGNNGNKEGLITGYYEPILHGSLTKNKQYRYPLYKRPNDLLIIDLSDIYEELKDYRLRGKIIGNKVLPYYSREEIEKGVKADLEPICYVDDKIGLFFMQIQGSGKIKLQDGTILNVGYSDQNGRPYYAVGKKLIDEKHIKKEDISLQTIRAWLEKNPDKIDDILNLNESYIFFEKSDKAATGSLGVELVPFRNLAVDRNYIPLGFPVFINTTNPIDNTPIRQLMVAADTGGAIKGEIRADFFFGNGDKAKELAGKMKQKGNLYILIPNIIEDRSDAHNK